MKFISAIVAAIAVGCLSTAALSQSTAVQWTTASGGNGHWYAVRNDGGTWLEARVSTESQGGHLATIASNAENMYIWSQLQVSPYNTCFAMLGASQDRQASDYSEPSGGWRWVTSEPFSFTAWFAGEPNNGLGSQIGEDYLYFRGYECNDQWNDLPNDCSEHTYIVEWSADCNSDGIVDYGQILSGQLADANSNGVPDCCEQGTDCSPVNLEAGLEVFLRFDGDCLDSSPYVRNGVGTEITYTRDPAGLEGSAASFDGQQGYISLDAVPIPTNNAFSWSIWIRCDALADQEVAVLERIQNIGNNLMSPSLWIRSNGAIGFGSYSFASGGTSVETASASMTAGVWSHIACTSDLFGRRRVYINGVLAGEGMSQDYGWPGPLVVLGRDRLDYGGRFRGAMDALRIYSRPLSSSEVDALFHLGAAADCNNDNIADYQQILAGELADTNTNGIPDCCEQGTPCFDIDADGVLNNLDNCPTNANPLQEDLDNDGFGDACDACPDVAGSPTCNGCPLNVCGECGIALDTDSDGTANCIDDDDDNDGVADSADAFPLDASESVDTDGDGIGNNADQDDDGDGADDATDGCPLDANKSAPGQCGCGTPDTDSDGDGVADCNDNCVAVSNPTQDDCNGNGIGEACESFTDCNANSIPDSCDIASGFAQDCNGNGKPDSCDIAAGNGSPYPGAVQWTVASGGNGHWYARYGTGSTWENARIVALANRANLAAITSEAENAFIRDALMPPNGTWWIGGYQGSDLAWRWMSGEAWNFTSWDAGQPDGATEQRIVMSSNGTWFDARSDEYWWIDSIFEWPATESDCNSNGIPDSCDIASGTASDCNTNAIPDSCELDSDADGTIDACDGCPNDPAKIAAGACGCGVADTDTDSDGNANCIDDDDDNDGVVDSSDAFPLDASESADTDGDGIGNNADQDDDGDGADDATDGCPLDANKSAPGQCGCGIADTDSDGDGVADCIDNCAAVSNPTQDDCNGDGIGEACESFTDCNSNSITDSCDIASGFAQDCNANGKPDSCDLEGPPNGVVAAWGRNDFGQATVPADLGKCLAIDAGLWGTTVVIREDRLVQVIGINWYYPETSVVPSDLGQCRAIAHGANHIMAVRVDGIVRVWGSGPGAVAPPPSVISPTRIACGGYHNLALLGDGTAKAWGLNDHGQLDIPTDQQVIALGGGQGHTLLVFPGGTIQGYGWNDAGQSTPPTGLTNVTKVDGGFRHSIARRVDGTVHCWGSNSHGQCDVPSTLGPVTDVNAGGKHSVALLENGGVVCWGFNASGACEVPPTLLPCSAIAAGGDDYYMGGHTVVLFRSAESDCNSNGIPDSCEIASGAASDCNTNGIPDSCELDSDADGTIDACDGCPNDPAKIAAGACGCGVADTDTDSDGNANCIDDDDDGDGVADSADAFPLDASESVDTDGDGIGNNADQDDDGDGADDATDGCPLDANKSAPGQCGCGIADTDSDGDSVADCVDNCVAIANPNQDDCNGNGIGEACESFTDCNANSIPDSCDLAARNGSPYPSAVQWTVASGGNGHWYAATVNSESLTWQQARELSEVMGGHLATETSEPESDFIFNIIRDREDCWVSTPSNGGFAGPWIGAFQDRIAPDYSEPAGGWRWVTGEQYNWECWTSGDPSDTDSAQDWACIGSNGLDKSKCWNDVPISLQLGAILVEWDAGVVTEYDCNMNGVLDSCDIASGNERDCNTNGIPDSCDIASGIATDSDADGTIDACDGCPNDPAKIAAGACGCGVAETDTDSDGTANCIDDDDDNDGVVDSSDAFPLDASESVDTDGDGVGNNADQDDDGDGADDAADGCPFDPSKSSPGQCGCGIADTDSDGDGVADCVDNCVAVANPTQDDCNGNGIGEACESFTDCNANSIPDSCDLAARNGSPYPGAVQWTVASGGNGHWYARYGTGSTWENARIVALANRANLAAITSEAENAFIRDALMPPNGTWWIGGYQGSDLAWRWMSGEAWNFTSWDAGQPDGATEQRIVMSSNGTWFDARSDEYWWIDSIFEWSATESDCNANGIPDSCDISSGFAGDCNANSIPDSCEVDTDADGTIDACDGCPNDPAKIAAGTCGCGVADTDTDSDGTANCIDDDDDNDGVADSADAFPLDASESVDTDGDGIGNNADQDDDGDGADDATDGCPLDANKSAPGQCGCGIADTDSDGDGVADCIDNCVSIPNPNQADCDSSGVGDACEFQTAIVSDDFNDGQVNPNLWQTYLPNSCSAITEANGVLRSVGRGQLRSALTYPLKNTQLTLSYMWRPVAGDELFSTVFRSDLTPAAYGGVTNGLFFDYYGGNLQLAVSANFAIESQAESGPENVTFGQWYQVTAVLQENFFGVVVTSIVDPNWQWTSQVYYSGDALGDRFVIHSREFCNTISEIDNLIIQTRTTKSDCNSNGVPDSCDIASGAAGDCNTNSIPDSCEVDSDADGTIDACDGCPNDPAKIAAGACGCGLADTDTDSDGTANCIDDDDDGDGVVDSADAFPLDANESLDTDGDGVGNNADQDDDGDGADDATDGCPLDANKSAPGQCGCGIADTDSDGDGVADCVDNCVAVANPNQDDCNGNGIGEACESFTDCNANSIPDSCDLASGFAQDCNGNGKPDSCDIAAGNGSPYPGAVQWTVASGGNGHWYWRNPAVVEWSIASSAANALGADLASITSQLENNFIQNMLPPGSAAYIGGIRENTGWRWVTGEQWSFTSWNPGEPNGGFGQILWIESTGGWNDHPGIYDLQASLCEWSTGLPTEPDCNANGIPDSCEIASGAAGDCNANTIPDSCELDSDADGTIDACDGCPNDPAKIAAGACGCGVADTDTDSDGTANCIDDDDDNDGVVDSADAFPLDASESVDTDGDGQGNNADQDDDGDGADDAMDGCPLDANKSAPGQCGCGIADTDSDGDGVADCVDNCVAVSNPTQDDCNGNGIGEACESFTDCNANSIPDSCDLANGFTQDCNGNGKPDSCDIAAGSGSPYPGAVQWTVASGGNGHWYKGIRASSLQDYVSARDAAMLVGGRLVSLGNAAESAWVFAQVTSDLTLWHINASDGNPYSIGPWIGAHSDTGWVWDDGTPWEFTAWYPGEPNGVNPNYILYFGGYTPQGPVTPKALWGDLWNQAATYSYIVEWSTGLPTESDCNANGVPDSCEIASGAAGDCDHNGTIDACEIAAGALDCNGNGIPDTCDVLSGGASVDCNANGIPDSCDIASGASMDCNSNAIPDSCDIAIGASRDVDSNGVPDECNPDCNNNDLPDAWEIAQGLVPDCNNNGIPDSCENDSRAANTGNMGRFGNGVPATGTLSAVVAATTAVTVRIEAVGDLGAATEYATLKLGQTVVGTLLFQTTGRDCPANPDVATLTLTKAQWNAIVASAGSSGNVAVTLTGSPLVDAAQCGEAGMSYVSATYGGPAYDCDANGLSDLCEVGSGTGDCNNNSVLDACELLSGSAPDIDANGVIDSCQTDCNGNSLPDTYEVAQGLVSDCNGNGIPDSCDLTGGAPDCNSNGIIDSCDIASGSAPDCNGNGKPDSCDISSGIAPDCNANSIPDSCDVASGTPDCNNNGVPDSCDVTSGAPDCNNNGVPDSCDVVSGSSNDVDTNGVPDECKTDCNANGLPDAWEILQHLVPDCNGNSVPDSCDVADGTAKDCNENGIPDSCDIAAGEVDKNSDGQPDDCQYRYGDFDLDGNIGGSDLAVLLALWGTIDPVVGDITGDGRVDGQDLAQILARWGPIS